MFTDRWGSEQQAREVLLRYARGSEALRSFLGSRGLPAHEPELGALDWGSVPLLDKDNFYGLQPYYRLVPEENLPHVFSLIRSGSTTAGNGRTAMLWPELRGEYRNTVLPESHEPSIKLFNLRERSTLMVLATRMGSWGSGVSFFYGYKTMAALHDLPLLLFAPGDRYDEVIEIIRDLHERFDQVVINVRPSAILRLVELAEERGFRLPLEKMIICTTGESFSESLRLGLQARIGGRASLFELFGVYGSSDTGLIGNESPQTIAVRQLLHRDPATSQALGFESGYVPNLYAIRAGGSYLEVIDGRLVVTRWRGLPLVRYDLKDAVRLLPWKPLCEALAERDPTHAERWREAAAMKHPDVIAVYGRDTDPLFHGARLYQALVYEAFTRSELGQLCTDRFMAWVQGTEEGQILHWRAELKASVDEPSPEQIQRFAKHLREALARLLLPAAGRGASAGGGELAGLPAASMRFEFCRYPLLTHGSRMSAAIKWKYVLGEGETVEPLPTAP